MSGPGDGSTLEMVAEGEYQLALRVSSEIAPIPVSLRATLMGPRRFLTK